MGTNLFGKYRGQVVDNLDPEQIGRLLVSVPDAFSDSTRWAMPCVPFAGNQSGFFALPPRGANVWVEFEWTIRYGAAVFGPSVPRCRFWR